ncbi:hypothetical protein [Metaclostridioides mangenotii]|uniref:hypothetical protein n=1 Tax=Metaclostridioides mangenotii TaxID=1540 RepID=UPI000464147A|nr:hypothetical protein [Clostridioides mangenotii]
MINDIAIVIILVLEGIGALISVFLLGRYVESRKIERFYKKYNEMNLKIKRMERYNQYLKNKDGLNNLTEDDIGEGIKRYNQLKLKINIINTVSYF